VTFARALSSTPVTENVRGRCRGLFCLPSKAMTVRSEFGALNCRRAPSILNSGPSANATFFGSTLNTRVPVPIPPGGADEPRDLAGSTGKLWYPEIISATPISDRPEYRLSPLAACPTAA
jgi:hypothetical protein